MFFGGFLYLLSFGMDGALGIFHSFPQQPALALKCSSKESDCLFQNELQATFGLRFLPVVPLVFVEKN